MTHAEKLSMVREALRDWRTKRRLCQLWDEGLTSGRAETDEAIDDIKVAARRPDRTSPIDNG